MFFLKRSLLFIILFPICIFALDYKVEFSGLKDKEALKVIKGSSNLILLQKKPPKTINALRFRANSDIEEMIQILHVYGYYDARVDIDLQEKKNSILVNVFISPGPQYMIKSIKIYNSLEENKELDLCDIKNKFPLKIDTPVLTTKILNAQQFLLLMLSTCGYPLAKIEKREVNIDITNKSAAINWYINPNTFCKFGEIRISGLKDIRMVAIDPKFQFQEGQTYNEDKVYETQQVLLATDLFSSVAITHAEKVDENSSLDMNVKVMESLHKYFTVGVSYATIDLFGVSFGWANRNFKSMGELLQINAYFAQRVFLGSATYRKTDFGMLSQDLAVTLEALRQKIPLVYLAFDYSLLTRIDKIFSKQWSGSLGLKLEYLDVTHSGNDGKFFLFSLPVYSKYTTTKSLLDPTDGYTVEYRATPFVNAIRDEVKFFKQTFTFEFYIPLEKSRTFVFATRSQLGSIVGPNVFRLPLTELFLGGSDDDLRGYRYRTVSPLNADNEPIGGRSAIYFSFEPRIRVSRTLGLVPFLDIGNVSNKKIPDIHEKWRKGVGVGLRYYSFFGPLRLDFGIPLNKRKGVDKSFRVYASIGQTF